MALYTIRRRGELEGRDVLAPERYDPRREVLLGGRPLSPTLVLGEIARPVRQTVHPSAGSTERCLVLDTSDAREGVLVARKPPVPLSDVGSAKKVARVHDVLISRLRPYLRQVAWVDPEAGGGCLAEGVTLLCSTEFFVLRSVDGASIAFLVPFLLSEPVQRVLAASQEGGHHPRFGEATLLSLPLPAALLEEREAISRAVERSTALFREAERGILGATAAVTTALETRR